MLTQSHKDLGFKSYNIKGYVAISGLGRGAFSSVYTCQYENANSGTYYVMKVFTNQQHAEVEKNHLSQLKVAGVNNIPEVVDIKTDADFAALIVSPVGIRMFDPQIDFITPDMMVTLVNVVQAAHKINIIHRDIKPENIFIDSKDRKRIILNDWSSSVLLEDKPIRYVGTSLYGDGADNNGMHIPTKSLDIRCLVKTLFSLSRQKPPTVIDNVYEAYWNDVENKFKQFKVALKLAEGPEGPEYKKLRKLLRKMW